MKKTAPPNYTQMPNSLLDDIHTMPEGALRVALVVCRQTFGYHKVKDRISLTQLEKKTGMSRQGCINGVNWLEKEGLLKTTQSKAGNLYQWVVNEVDHLEDEVVNLVDQGSQPSRPQVVNVVDTQKKEKKSIKENIAGDARPDKDRDLFFDKLADLTQSEPKLHGALIGKTKAQLIKVSATLEELSKFEMYWYAQDWRGKQGQAPTLPQIVAEWGRARVWDGKPAQPQRPQGKTFIRQQATYANDEQRNGAAQRNKTAAQQAEAQRLWREKQHAAAAA